MNYRTNVVGVVAAMGLACVVFGQVEPKKQEPKPPVGQPETPRVEPKGPGQDQPKGEEKAVPEETRKVTMTLMSASFENDTQMPKRHTVDGEEGKGKDISPPLKWGNAPKGTKEFAVLMFDPDARNFVHWVIYGIPATVTELPEGLPGGKENEKLTKPVEATQGKNQFGQIGYRGPAARPGGGVHHYNFRVYALDTKLELKPGATRKELDAAMKGHILAEGELVGNNER